MIYELLGEGKENKIHCKELMKLAGYKNRRCLTDQIQRERQNGRLILATKSGGGGYFLAKDTSEVAEWVKSIEHSSVGQLAMLKTAKEYLKEHEVTGQISFIEKG